MLKKVGVLYHPKVEATREKAGDIQAFLNTRGVTAWTCSSWDNEKVESLLEGTDLIITVGGDGTILRAARIAAAHKIPTTGINLGKLGFLTELDVDDITEKLPAIIYEEGWIDERAMLQAEVVSESNKHIYHALNDIVVARGKVVRLIRVQAYIDAQAVTTYKTDGLIVSTATGSTSYAMAAGGPIIYPGSKDILMVPVAPHLSMISPLVLPGDSEIELKLDTYHGATLSVDGHVNITLLGEDTIRIRRSDQVTRFLRICPKSYFYSNLEEKLYGKRIKSRKS